MEDMGEGKKGWTIERIDNNGNYELWNCCWATMTRQNRNSRRNIIVNLPEFNGCLWDACVHFGISYATVHQRLGRGWQLDEEIFIIGRRLNMR